MIDRGRHWRVLATLAGAAALFGAGGGALAPIPALGRDPGFAHSVQPQTAALAITVRTCPAGYDPTGGGDYLRDCREPAGDTLFKLRRGDAQGPSASTGTSGDQPQESTVRFMDLTAGRYTIAVETPPEIAGAFVGACTSDAREVDAYPFIPYARVETGTLAVQLEPGETLACDWYQVLEEVDS